MPADLPALRRLPARLLPVAILCLHCSLAAAFTARLDVRSAGQSLTGQVNCAPGGDIAGEALLDYATDAQTGPLLQSGGRTAGRYELRLVFKGKARPGSPESYAGSADLSGVFTFSDGRTAMVMGTSEFTARGSIASGLVRVEAPWRVSCMGGGLTSPQELTLTLPPYTLQYAEAGATPAPGAAVGSVPLATAPPAVATPAAPPALPTGLPTGLPVAPAAPPVPAGAPTASGGLLEAPLLNVIVGPQQTENGRCVQPASALGAQTKTVYAFVEIKSPLPGGQVLATLYHGTKVKEKHLIAAGPGDKFIITFYPTNTEYFPEGKWALQLQAAGRDVGYVPFAVGGQ